MTTRALLWLLCCSGLGCHEFADPKPPAFEVNPPSLSYNGRVGGLNPPPQYLTVTEVDVRPVRWTASADAPWVQLATGGDTLPYFLAVGVTSGGLGVGTYAATILIQRTEGGRETRTIPVTVTLAPVVSLDGRWVGTSGNVAVSLNLGELGGSVSGWGSLSAPSRVVAVAGTYTPPNISLVLLAQAGDTTRVTGSFANDNTIAAVLNDRALTNARITLYRQ